MKNLLTSTLACAAFALVASSLSASAADRSFRPAPAPINFAQKYAAREGRINEMNRNSAQHNRSQAALSTSRVQAPRVQAPRVTSRSTRSPR